MKYFVKYLIASILATMVVTNAQVRQKVPSNKLLTPSDISHRSAETTLSKFDTSSVIKVLDYILFNFDSGPQGWVATTGPGAVTDWKLSNSFTKLGGPFSGSSWVTERPDKPSTYTEGAYASSQGYSSNYPGPNLLTSPVFDLSAAPYSDLYISFYHNLRTEPLWDRSWMQYSTDGITWHHLGVLNDPNGLNWYQEALYQNALFQYPDYWPPYVFPYKDELNVTFPLAGWSTNNDGRTPSDWVYTQKHICDPAIARSPHIQFRFIAYSDAATAPDPGGWAFDNFGMFCLPQAFPEGWISGIVFHDVNGNGVKDIGEQSVDSVKMKLYRYESLLATTTTSDGGQYNFGLTYINIPAYYEVMCEYQGYSFSVPQGVSGVARIFHPCDYSTKIQNFGFYVGSVNGVNFDDLNDNGIRDPGEPGLAGWTIELHKDSVNGELVNSAITGEDGSYTMLAPPYPNYVLKENTPDGTRRTYPLDPGTHSFAIGGNSGSETAILTGKDFGNFVKAIISLEVRQDRDGNGVRDSSDYAALPPGTPDLYFDVFKNGNYICTDTLKYHIPLIVRSNLEYGTYSFKRTSSVPPGWLQTNLYDSITFTVNRGSIRDTASFLYFRPIIVSGTTFNDLNTNGIKDNGESGMSGWTISLSGNGGGTTVTDTNGNYYFSGGGPGVHTISAGSQTGWVKTKPSAGNYTFSAITADQGGNISDADFGIYFGINLPLSQGWNLVSLPSIATDNRSSILFPSSNYSQPFCYLTSGGGYAGCDTMFNRIGYWLKSNSQQIKLITGYPIESDTVDVVTGWNLIGSISWPIPVNSIMSEPLEMAVSQFFGYDGQYLSTDTLFPGKGYWVKVNQSGALLFSSTIPMQTKSIRVVSVSELPPPPPSEEHSNQLVPTQFVLGNNYPNPFNPLTNIAFALPRDCYVTLKVYDVLGREVALLMQDNKSAGEYTVTWDAEKLPSGMYFYQLSAGDFLSTKKMVLMK
jgi:hypothetical protein